MNITPRSPVRRRRAVALVTAVAVSAGFGLTACGDDDDDDDGAATESDIVITDAWARSSPMVASAGAAYMVITNPGDADDALVAAAVDDEVAATVEIHETRPVEGSATMPNETTMGGMSGTTPMSTPMLEMVPVERIDVPAGGAAVLEPGGFHIMLLDLAEPLEDGDEIELTLTFEEAGERTVTAVVGDEAP